MAKKSQIARNHRKAKDVVVHMLFMASLNYAVFASVNQLTRVKSLELKKQAGNSLNKIIFSEFMEGGTNIWL